MRQNGFTMLELLIAVAIIAILAAIAVPNFLEAQTRAKVSRARMDLAATSLALESYQADWRSYPVHSAPLRNHLLAITREGLAIPLPSAEEYVQVIAPPGFVSGNPFATVEDDTVPTTDTLTLSTAAMVGAEPSALARLTTPVAYIAGVVPLDVFDRLGVLPLTYIDSATIDAQMPEVLSRVPRRRYLLFSIGPDNDGSYMQKPSDRGGRKAPRAATPHQLTTATTHPILGPYQPYDPTNGTISGGDLYHFGVGTQLSKPEAPRLRSGE